jgi:DNA-directed RNA polymerase specialized sigma24 family protein
LAHQKALEVMQAFQSGAWRPDEASPAQICAFLKSVARNGLADLSRRSKHEVLVDDRTRRDNGRTGRYPVEPADDGTPENSAAGQEVALAIAGCALRLTPRSRLVWMLRTFYEWSSEEIAQHPEVETTPAAIDTMLLRCRRALAECLNSKGIGRAVLPGGTFVSLWESLSHERAAIDSTVGVGRTRHEPGNGHASQ